MSVPLDFYAFMFFCKSDLFSVGTEQRQNLKILNIRSVFGIALCQDSHFAYDISAGVLDKLFDGTQRISRADDVVNDQDAFASHILGILAVKIERLLFGRCNGINLTGKGIAHVKLLHFSGHNVFVLARLTRHFIYKGNALALRGDHDVVLGRDLKKLARAGDRQLYIAEYDKCADAKRIVQGTQGKLSFEACHLECI